MTEIYTIGYADFELGDFIAALKSYGVTALVDVRSEPHSTYYKDFDAENISRALKIHGIIYRNYGAEFGARQLDRNFYTGNTLDFGRAEISRAWLRRASHSLGRNVHYSGAG